jgi:hypothetical protein
MPPSQRYYRSRSYASIAGQEAARRHIEEARQFEKEMGGTVSDVKQYFFDLKDTELNAVFSAYNRQYGASKEAYARQAFSKWKSGSTQMSGLVAKRLFDLLPPRMPITTKLELAGNVWRHFGTSSTHHFTVGPNADPKLVIGKVHETLTAQIRDYNIPENIKNRFDWLAAGDISVKEHLLNYFTQMDRKIATDSLNEKLPVLPGADARTLRSYRLYSYKNRDTQAFCGDMDRSEARCAVSGRTAGTKAVGQQRVGDDLVSHRDRRDRRNNLPVAPLGWGKLAYIEEQTRSSPSQRFIFTAVAETSPAAIRGAIGRYRVTQYRLIGTGLSVAGIPGNLDTRARPD